jgi:hypothetical protein
LYEDKDIQLKHGLSLVLAAKEGNIVTIKEDLQRKVDIDYVDNNFIC